MEKSKVYIVLTIGLLISVFLTFVDSTISLSAFNLAESKVFQQSKRVLNQSALRELDEPITVSVLYENNQVVGTITNYNKIEKMINDEKADKYSEEFPDSNLGLGEDVYIVEEMSYYLYEDIDDQIIKYIIEKDLLAIEVNKITFSNGGIIYVKNIEDFENAREKYLLNFVSESELAYIKEGQIPPAPKGYGSSALTLQVKEDVEVSLGFTSINNILLNEREVTEFLSYGYDVEKEFYAVQELDTVDGIARMAGISPQQLLTINPEIKSREQLLKQGQELNITYFDSPINVIVEKQTVKEEIVYPESTQYINDPTLREGVTVVSVRESYGSKKVTYKETYINGQIRDGVEVLDSEILVEPTREVIRRGTMILPSVGSGSFRYPVDNVSITCGWYCYSGHTAIDVINSYQRYGPVKAADRGVVVTNSYSGINGYYMVINHNNGYRTYYGHMNRPGYFPVGYTVTKGEIIGQIGMTGYATGPHVHFMVEYQGRYINPMLVLGR